MPAPRFAVERFDPQAPRLSLKQSRIVCGDGVALMRRLPEASVHLILSDIPYGIGLDEWDVLHENTNSAFLGRSPAQRRAGNVFRRRGKPINGWSDADRSIPRQYYEWCASWASEWRRVLKPGGSALVFAGRRLAPRCVTALEDAGFNFRDLLGWLRPRAPHRAQRLSVVFERRGDAAAAQSWAGWRVGNLRPAFEPIVWCFKPYRITIADNVLEHQLGAYHQTLWQRRFGHTDNVVACGFGPGEAGLHRAQKPLELMRGLIELTTLPDQIVVDPFAGSGSSAVAAHELGRRFIAADHDIKNCRVLCKRLKARTAPRRSGVTNAPRNVRSR